MKINKIFILIYLVTLTSMLWYNLSHVVVNDGVKEYQEYLMNIENGWKFRQTLINSCLVNTWILAMIQRLTNLDSMILFRIFPTLFYALMPAFTYLIAKRYLSMKYALVSVLVMVFSSYILYFPDMGRVGVALGFMAGMMWALLEKRLIWAIVFAILMVFSHYGTSLIAMGIVGMGFVIPLFKKKVLRQYLVVACLLVLLIGVWHFRVASYAGEVMSDTLLQTEKTGQILEQNADVFDLRNREPAVQAAIGLTDTTMPQKIEVVANWFVVGLITLGLYYAVRSKMDGQFKTMAVAFWGLILFTVAMPWLSVYYGGMRVYFTSLVFLGVCFPLGAEKIAKLVHVPSSVLMGVVLALYGLSTSGIIYLPFGMEKTFPVAVTLP